MRREIPLYTLDGVPDARITTHWFWTEDKLGLSLLRFENTSIPNPGEAVLIVHGLTTSTDMFIMPEHENLVAYLHKQGFGDVWCLDYRMSNRFSYNLFKHKYTMDDVALFDYPPALDTMRAEIGDKPIHVISHCLGANSFVMSLFGKAIDGVSSVIANSVSLVPRVPLLTELKMRFAFGIVEYGLGFPYLNPSWGDDPGFSRGKVFTKLVSLVHRECDVSSCHMLSLMWGAGWPALYEHDNLADVTHRRGGDLYGATSLNYQRHVRKMIKAGGAVKYSPNDPTYDRLPNDYFQYAAEVTTPMLLMTGENNKVFTDSNIVCHQRLEKIAPGRHELYVIPGYGHQDPFMGEHVSRDVFPRLVEFIEKHRYDEPQRFSTAGSRVG